ncbi:MAG: metallophosphoesterase [Candidatus Latescibacterota bacterium]
MQSSIPERKPVLTRRSFLALGNAAGIGLAAGSSGCASARKGGASGDTLRFGVITDLHYADREPWTVRHYRDSLAKLEECVRVMNGARPAFLIELGDIIDKAEKDIETGYLRTVNDAFGKFRGPRYYVLGNHDVATFSKEEFLALSGAPGGVYAFDAGEYRGIVLDGNFNPDGGDYKAGNFNWTESYIHAAQREWLGKELERAGDRRVLVFVHQNLHDESNPHGVKNAPEVRSILERAGNVIAVFQGHDHAGDLRTVNGIPYITFEAAVDGPGLENNAFTLVTVEKERMRMQGYGKQDSHEVGLGKSR